MNAAMKRDRLITYLSEANEKKVSALYSILEKEIKDTQPEFTEEQLEIINERRAELLSGKVKGVELQTMFDNIRKRKKAAK